MGSNNATYLISLKRYDEYRLVVKQLLESKAIESPKQAIFITLLERERVRKLSGIGYDFPRSHLIGLFTESEIARLTRDAGPDIAQEIVDKIKAMDESASTVIDGIIADMPDDGYKQSLAMAKTSYDRLMKQAVELTNINGAIHAIKYLERQVMLIQKDYEHETGNKALAGHPAR